MQPLLHDAYFGPSQAPITPEAVFALSDAMRRFADQTLRAHPARHGGDPRQALLDALYHHGPLQLRYDAGATRTAAQAFDARAGNCLSLVIMTAAFARYLGLPVSYQRVLEPPSYSLAGALVFANGHVNLVLSPSLNDSFAHWPPASDLQVDFVPPSEFGARRTERIDPTTVLAMFYNNRAAEALADGRLADAYAWARAAVLRGPRFGAALNTLAVIYLQAGHPAAAEAALQQVLALEPRSTTALGNLVTALQRQGRSAQAQAVAARLAAIQPEVPFEAFELGRQAMARGDYARARQWFAQELQLQPDQPDVHFWAALADLQLGHREAAARHLEQARDNSYTTHSHDLYSAKLARLRALQVQ
ncbi:MAG: tetratricopeptide repeat protein [Burkholderiales bacterium]|nr:tetratricopeptide repeat protein [Burkholderiales bacterium]